MKTTICQLLLLKLLLFMGLCRKRTVKYAKLAARPIPETALLIGQVRWRLMSTFRTNLGDALTFCNAPFSGD